VITDTIGFIRNLPHRLISSFQSTLLDVTEADLLLHVVDISSHKSQENIDSVNEVLSEIECSDKNILMVFNKCDLVDSVHLGFLKKEILQNFPDSVFLSAKKGENIKALFDKIEYYTGQLKMHTFLNIPNSNKSLISFVHSNAEVLNVIYEEKDDKITMEVKISGHILTNLKKQIEKIKLKQYINNKTEEK